MHLMRAMCVIAVLMSLGAGLVRAQPTVPRDREGWIALAKGGFTLSPDQRAIDLLQAMNPLLASPDPVLRDDVAYSAAERWILRDKLVPPDGLRALTRQWTSNLGNGLAETGDDRVFGRSFSALCLSVIASADLSVAVYATRRGRRALRSAARLLRAREGSPRVRPGARLDAHRRPHSDALKFLARNPKLGPGADIVAGRRQGEDRVVRHRVHLGARTIGWRSPCSSGGTPPGCRCRGVAGVDRAVGGGAPDVVGERAAGQRARFAQVENAKQVMRSLHAALTMESSPTPTGTAAARTVLAALAKMR